MTHSEIAARLDGIIKAYRSLGVTTYALEELQDDIHGPDDTDSFDEDEVVRDDTDEEAAIFG